MSDEKVTLYALSTCSHCKSAKKFLDKCGVKYDCIEVDTKSGAERDAVIEKVKQLNPNLSFPTLVIGQKVIVGYRENEIKEALGL
ncbi:MAG: glutaredoxin family protein [Deltaproteobacteria bacterium]|nr:glutaredoxin family protein [Deltaproteobacteria bacterium]